MSCSERSIPSLRDHCRDRKKNPKYGSNPNSPQKYCEKHCVVDTVGNTGIVILQLELRYKKAKSLGAAVKKLFKFFKLISLYVVRKCSLVNCCRLLWLMQMGLIPNTFPILSSRGQLFPSFFDLR